MPRREWSKRGIRHHTPSCEGALTYDSPFHISLVAHDAGNLQLVFGLRRPRGRSLCNGVHAHASLVADSEHRPVRAKGETKKVAVRLQCTRVRLRSGVTKECKRTLSFWYRATSAHDDDDVPRAKTIAHPLLIPTTCWPLGEMAQRITFKGGDDSDNTLSKRRGAGRGAPSQESQ